MRTFYPGTKVSLLFLLLFFMQALRLSAQTDLSASFTSNSPTYGSFSYISYYLTIKNKGPQIATNVSVSYPLPANVSYNCDKPSVGLWRAWEPAGTWAVGTLNPGDSATIQTNFFCGSGPSIIASATVTSTTAGFNDLNPANNTATLTTTLGAASSLIPCSGSSAPSDSVDLEMTNVITNPEVNVGLIAPFVVNIKNYSSKAATGVKVKFALPASLQFSSATLDVGTYDPASGIWTVGTVNGNAGYTMVLDCNVVTGGPINTVAEVNACDQPDKYSKSNNYNPNAAVHERDEAPLTILGMETGFVVSVAALTPTQAKVGDTLIFQVVLKNQGPTRGDGIKIVAYTPGGTAYVSSTANVGEYDPAVGVWLKSHIIDPNTGNKSGFTINAGISDTLILRVRAVQTGQVVFFSGLRSSDMPDLNLTPSVYTGLNYQEARINVVNNLDTTISDLAVNQTLIKTPVNVGDSIVFQIGLTNLGLHSANAITVQDAVPSLIIVSSVTPSLGTFINNVWTVPTLGNQGFATLTVRGTAGCMVSAIQNTAQITASSQSDPIAANNMAILNVGPTNCSAGFANVALSQTILKTPVLNGDSLVFQVILTNNGSSGVTNIMIKDSLPAALSGLIATASLGTFANKNWTVGALSAGASVTLTFRGVVTLTSSTVNTALVSASMPAIQASVQSVISFNPTGTPVANLTLSMTVNPTSGNKGTPVVYTLTLTNTGNADATGVSVKDSLPGAITFNSYIATLGTYSALTGVWNVGTLPKNSSVTLTINANVANIVSTIVNTAQVIAYAPKAANAVLATASATISSAAANTIDLRLSLQAPGPYSSALPIYQNVTFTCKVVNNGPAVATGVSVKYPVAAGMAYNSNSATKGAYEGYSGIWTIGVLNPGDSAVLSLTLFTLSTTTTQFAQVWTASPADCCATPGNNTDNIPHEPDEALLLVPSGSPVKRIDLKLTQTADKTLVAVGNSVNIALSLQNNGDTTATGVTVKYILPAGLTYVSSTASQGAYNPATGIWTIGTTPNLGASRTLSVAVTVNAITTPIVNFAQVCSADQPDIHSVFCNNTDNLPHEPDEATVILYKQGGGSQTDLALSITTLPTYTIYNTHDFTLTLKNNGGVSATGVTVDFPFPPHFVNGGFVSSSTGTSYDAYFHLWTVGTVLPGQSVTMTLRLFNLDASGPIHVYADVKTSSPLDLHSVIPDPLFVGIPLQPSEAAIDILPAGAAHAEAQATALAKAIYRQTLPVVINKIYPNPSEGEFFIECTSIVDERVNIQLFNAAGWLQRSEKIDIKKGENRVFIDILELPAGVYFVVLTSNALRHSPMKIVKL